MIHEVLKTKYIFLLNKIGEDHLEGIEDITFYLQDVKNWSSYVADDEFDCRDDKTVVTFKSGDRIIVLEDYIRFDSMMEEHIKKITKQFKIIRFN